MTWPTEDVTRLRALWADDQLRVVEIARQIGRPAGAVSHKAARLGLEPRAARRRPAGAKSPWKRRKVVRVADPLVGEFLALIDLADTHKAVAVRAGLHNQIIHQWARGLSPRLPNFVAALGALGYGLQIVPLGEVSASPREDESKCRK